MNSAILGIGSNIDALANIEKAEAIIRKDQTITKKSAFVTTKAVDMPGEPDFLNGAFSIETLLTFEELKGYLKNIEDMLGRSPAHKINESRTIDLDIIVFNGRIVNGDFELYAFVREAVLELAPELKP
jgi:2-amino-4-hydroxy-6-hydroxymethyldihydropteridine diphosphokinase